MNKSNQKHNSIAILILFYEKLDLTIDCIKSTLNPNINVYVLNNGSNINNWEILKRKFHNYSQLKFIDNNLNLGPAGGRNKLIKETKENWLFFIDNDIIINTNNWYEKLFFHIENHPEFDAFIPRLYNYHEKEYLNFHKYILKNKNVKAIPLNNNEETTNYFPGGAAIVNRQVFKRIGFYDENLFVLEDIEFPLRAIVNNNSLKVLKINDIKLVHIHKYTRNKHDIAAIKNRYNQDKYIFAEEYIQKKLDIKLDSHWRVWSLKQVYKMTRENLIRKIKNKILYHLKK